MKRLHLLLLLTLTTGPAGTAAAQTPRVDVRLGPAVVALGPAFGADDLDHERAYLQRDVEQALARSANAPRAVHLVVEDIQPNRPTPRELGRSQSLSPFTTGLGGAAVTGQVIEADGATRPVRYRFFPPDLQSETHFDTWGDADQAFDILAHRIADGQPPDDPRPWPAPHRPQAPTGTLIPPA